MSQQEYAHLDCTACNRTGDMIGFGQIAYPCTACQPVCERCEGRKVVTPAGISPTSYPDWKEACPRCDGYGHVWVADLLPDPMTRSGGGCP